MKPRVLFVDDEPLVLQGLERMLRGRRREWEMEFIADSHAALDRVLRAADVDVVVSDMRMPGLNGMELLSAIQEHQPWTIRLLLSGHADPDLIFKSTRCAHQFLPKPCRAEELHAVVDSCIRHRGRIPDAGLQALAAGPCLLPCAPGPLEEFAALVRDPGIEAQALLHIVRVDPALGLQCLRLANACFFGTSRGTARLAESVARVGPDSLRTLLQDYGLFPAAEAEHTETLVRLQARAVRVARLARRMATDGGAPAETAALAEKAGLLLDLGRWMLAVAPQTATPHPEPPPLALVGYLLTLWAVPPDCIEAVDPGEGQTPQRSQAGYWAHLADALIHACDPAAGQAASPFGEELIATVAEEERFADWCEAACEALPAMQKNP